MSGVDNPSEFIDLPLLSPNTHCKCLLCDNATDPLLEADKLKRQGLLSYVQFQSCEHTYCTRCCELICVATVQLQDKDNTEPVLCFPNDCHLNVLLPRGKVVSDNVHVSTRQCRLGSSPNNSLQVSEVRVSLREHRDRITQGQGQIDEAASNATLPLVWPEWVFVTQPSNIKLLQEIVEARRSDGRLFQRVLTEQRRLAQKELDLFKGKASQCYHVPDHAATLQHEAKIFGKVPDIQEPNACNSSQRQMPYQRNLNYPELNVLQLPSPFLVDVQSLVGEFLYRYS